MLHYVLFLIGSTKAVLLLLGLLVKGCESFAIAARSPCWELRASGPPGADLSPDGAVVDRGTDAGTVCWPWRWL